MQGNDDDNATIAFDLTYTVLQNAELDKRFIKR